MNKKERTNHIMKKTDDVMVYRIRQGTTHKDGFFEEFPNETSKAHEIIYPLFKMLIEDAWKSEQIDSNTIEITKKTVNSIHIKTSVYSLWELLNVEVSDNVNKALKQLDQIKGSYKKWKKDYIDTPPVMFVYNGSVYVTPEVSFKTFCVSGVGLDSMEGNRVVLNFFESFVEPYPKNLVLVHKGEVYLNGERIYTRNDLLKLNIKFPVLFGSIRRLIENNYPEATYFETAVECGPM